MDRLPFLKIKYAADCGGRLVKGRRELSVNQKMAQMGCKFVRNKKQTIDSGGVTCKGICKS